MDSTKTYVPYHVHTHYSLLDSCSTPDEYINLCKEQGIPAISFSEHGKPLNWFEKWMKCKEAGVKYIHSVEIYLTETLEPKVRDNYHTVLIAKNLEGMKELNRLVTLSSQEDHTYYTNRLSFDEFLSISDNIISTSACLASPLSKLSEDHPYYVKLLQKYDYLEVQHHNCDAQREYNQRLCRLANKYNKPLIAGTDSHASSQYKAECRTVFMGAKGKFFENEDQFDMVFKSYDELVEAFKVQDALPEDVYLQAINNTNRLNELCEELDLDTSIKYPISYGSREEDARRLVDAIQGNFTEKVKAGVIPKEQIESFKTAIVEELRVFRKLGMEGFMLTMHEILNWCKHNNIVTGPARGSVGGSRIAYVLDIIDLNPEQWHTVFSRFCNEFRVEIGDIDIDVIEEDRPKIFQYIFDRYGAEYTARVASFGTLQTKAAIKEICRFKRNKWELDHDDMTPNPYKVSNVEKIIALYESGEKSARSEYEDIFYYLDGLVGTKSSQSVHPAGLVISPITLSDNYGTFIKDEEPCLLLDMDNIHECGLAKFDFLILKTVQVIKDVCNMVKIPYPKSHEMDWNDQKVWRDMAKYPNAIFQFEGEFAFNSLKRFRPKSIEDLAMVTAAIRPSGASYRNNLLARIPHKNPSPIIDELLKDNLGYLIYQEDTIKFLMDICGLSGGESDNIRRAIGRKQKDRLEQAMPSILDGYCRNSSLPRKEAELEAKEFLRIIEDSSNYQFGYNHAIAYAMVGYLCAYFRYYYPIEFATAYLNAAANDDDIFNGTELAMINGITVTMPKWGISRKGFSYDEEKQTIAKGLSSVKHISDKTAEQLFRLSKTLGSCDFVHILDVIVQQRICNSRAIGILIGLDFFDEFGNQNELFKITELYFDALKKGEAKSIKRDIVANLCISNLIIENSNGLKKDGEESKSYTITNMSNILRNLCSTVRSLGIEEVPAINKSINYYKAMGYPAYVSGKKEDKPYMMVIDIHQIKSYKRVYGVAVVAKSIGSGKETEFRINNNLWKKQTLQKGDIIYLEKGGYSYNGRGFDLSKYKIITRIKDSE